MQRIGPVLLAQGVEQPSIQKRGHLLQQVEVGGREGGVLVN